MTEKQIVDLLHILINEVKEMKEAQKRMAETLQFEQEVSLRILINEIKEMKEAQKRMAETLQFEQELSRYIDLKYT